MALLGKIAKFALGGLIGGALLNSKGKAKPATSSAPAPIMRDDAAAIAAREDELRKRRGAAADILTGSGGAEAGAGSTGRAIVGN